MNKSGEKRKTVGELSRNLQLKNDKVLHTSTDQMKEQLDGYEENVSICLKEHIKKFPNDFFLVVLTKKEKLMSNVIRNYFYGRLSCPTPDYDQVVYHYHQQDDHLEFLWVIPDRKTCKYMKTNSASIDPSQWKLLSYVLRYSDGSLFKLTKKLNGEKPDTPQLEEN